MGQPEVMFHPPTHHTAQKKKTIGVHGTLRRITSNPIHNVVPTIHLTTVTIVTYLPDGINVYSHTMYTPIVMGPL